MAGDGEELRIHPESPGVTETFFVLAEADEELGGLRPAAALHRSITCGYLLAGAMGKGRTIAEIRGDPEEWLRQGGHCICSHCGLD